MAFDLFQTHKIHAEPNKLFTPLQIPGRSFTFDMMEASSITHSSNSVSRIDDVYSNGIYAEQTDADKRPTYESANNSINFDGTDDYLAGASGSYSNFIFIIVDASGYTDASSPEVPFAQADVQRSIAFGAVTGSISGEAITYLAGGRRDATTTDLSSGVQMLGFRKATGSQEIFLNGGDDIADLNSGSANDFTPNAAFHIGQDGASGTRPYGGKIKVLLNLSTTPDDAMMDRIFGYYAHRYSLTSILPSDHPYKTFKP